MAECRKKESTGLLPPARSPFCSLASVSTSRSRRISSAVGRSVGRDTQQHNERSNEHNGPGARGLASDLYGWARWRRKAFARGKRQRRRTCCHAPQWRAAPALLAGWRQRRWRSLLRLRLRRQPVDCHRNTSKVLQYFSNTIIVSSSSSSSSSSSRYWGRGCDPGEHRRLDEPEEREAAALDGQSSAGICSRQGASRMLRGDGARRVVPPIVAC
jgi:hypothetical protein